MDETAVELEIDRERAERYVYWRQFLFPLVFPLGLLWGIGAAVGLVYLAWPGPALSRRQAAALSYRLDGTLLRVDSGVYFLSRKAIPLDRITDFALRQGPLMRHFGVWRLDVQTAGSTQIEASLFALRDPSEVRTRLLAARDRAARGAA